MEIVQERLEREFDQDLITTAPSVVYQVVQPGGEVVMVENPSKMPDQGKLQEIREPIVTVHLYMPQDYVGPVMTLANQKRGVQMNMAYHGRQVMLTYELPRSGDNAHPWYMGVQYHPEFKSTPRDGGTGAEGLQGPACG
eukprot:gene37950-46828_t